jgi:hypothetical protein
VDLLLIKFFRQSRVKKIGQRYKYYLTKLGRTVVTTALKLRELFIIPALNEPALL